MSPTGNTVDASVRGSSSPVPPQWWRQSVIYQIYPRSFADSNGDGVGDLAGIRSRLDHLEHLGVDALWLSPTQPSPMADFGYDVADYCDIDPLFGDLAAFDDLVDDVHRRGMRLVMDYVPNHTSDRHPWFAAARDDPDSPYRDYYVWRDPAPDGGPPNNWLRAFSPEPAWTLDEASGQYYLHLFLPEQPDLDWNNPGVRRDMADVLRFWMDRGVDGFRADVVHCIGKPATLPDAPDDLAGLPACIFDQGPGTHERLRELRSVVDGSDPGRHLLLGETAVFDREQQLGYLGAGDELHLAFNFLALHTQWDAEAWRAEIRATYDAYESIGAWPTWVMSNHDLPRHASRYGSTARARAAAVLLLTLRGTPFLYQGEELGLFDADVPEGRVVDPGGRDGCRAPMPWTREPEESWGAEPWLPVGDGRVGHDVETQQGNPASMLEHYRRLLALRRSEPLLRTGAIDLLDAPDGVLRFVRGPEQGSGPDGIEVAVNFTDEPIAAAHSAGRWLGGTTWPPPPDGLATGHLGPDEAVVVEPG
ncbi:MAG: alpha-amylase family glycosyl hydrolase [Microthrixaceae bacterium]|nr:alpha-amylase family glycosyl hydrolase [Microthrixaceae bacterium]